MGDCIRCTVVINKSFGFIQMKYSGVLVLTQYCEICAADHVPGSVCIPHDYHISTKHFY